MASYGVPTDPDGALPWTWAEDRLAACRNYWVVTVNASGRPAAMPVWGVWRQDPPAFFFSCAPDARKARKIAQNPQVCVMIDDTVECVSVEGIASLVEDEAARTAAATTYAQKYSAAEEQASMREFVLGHAIFEVRPLKALAIIEREEDFASKATRWSW